MPKILMFATPYGYGPTSKLICVAEELAEAHELIFMSSEPGLSLAKRGPFERLIAVDDRDRWPAAARDALHGAALLVSFLDYRALRPAREAGVPAIFFDTLHWLRVEPLPNTPQAALYIAQNFFEIEGRKTHPLVPRWRQVGPVLPRGLDGKATTGHGGDRVRRILVNFGGLRSPSMLPDADLCYVSWVAKILRSTALDGVDLVLCLPIYLQKHLTVIKKVLPLTELCFPYPNQFLDQLTGCDVLVTVPGLEVVLEAMYLGVPLVFLPPYNGSQLLQSRIYEQRDIALHTLCTKTIPIPGATLSAINSLTQSVQIYNAVAADDDALTDKLGRELAVVLAQALADPRWSADRARHNRELLLDLGSDGRVAAASAIERVLEE